MRLPADAVDISLRKIINEELVCFVDICALSIKVLRGHKVFTALKVFAFDSDEGVSGQLGRLATLVERESQMRATLGFESQKTSERNIIENKEGTKKINATVDRLLTFEKKKEADNVAKRLLNSIDSSLDTPSETHKTSQTIYKRLLNDQVPGSGEWLRTDPLYTAWAKPQDSSCSILGISGGKGYGKSFLFAAIVQHLQEAHAQVADDLSVFRLPTTFLNTRKEMLLCSSFEGSGMAGCQQRCRLSQRSKLHQSWRYQSDREHLGNTFCQVLQK